MTLPIDLDDHRPPKKKVDFDTHVAAAQSADDLRDYIAAEDFAGARASLAEVQLALKVLP